MARTKQTARRGKKSTTELSRPIIDAAPLGSPEEKKKELTKMNIK